ncbi:MAG: hypothetical protein AB1521_00480 [Bacteroidota bacterium]
MDIISQYVLRTLVELALLNKTPKFVVANQLLLLASTLREEDLNKLEAILDDFVKKYTLLSYFRFDTDKVEIEISQSFPKPTDGTYDLEMIHNKLVRRILLYKLYLTYLVEGGKHAFFTLGNLTGILNISKEEILRHVEYLEDEYYVEYAFADGGMSTTHLTNHGVKLCENRFNLFDEYCALKLSIEERDDKKKESITKSFTEGFTTDYISAERISELYNVNSTQYDLSKLRQLLKELNYSAKHKNIYSIAMIIRAILDHVPPIFGFNTFQEVVNNYSWSKSNKELISRLESSLRNIADSYLHTKIKKKEIIPSLTQVDFRPEIDVLIIEVLSIIK